MIWIQPANTEKSAWHRRAIHKEVRAFPDPSLTFPVGPESTNLANKVNGGGGRDDYYTFIAEGKRLYLAGMPPIFMYTLYFMHFMYTSFAPLSPHDLIWTASYNVNLLLHIFFLSNLYWSNSIVQ